MRAFVLAALLPLAAAAAGPEKADPKQALIQRDRDFAKTAVARDHAAFKTFLGEDVMTFGTGAERQRGKMAEMFAPFFTAGGPSISWEPESAEVSGDLGYTWGTYRRVVQGKTGAGSYVTIWRKGKDGLWRVAVDIGTPPEPVSP